MISFILSRFAIFIPQFLRNWLCLKSIEEKDFESALIWIGQGVDFDFYSPSRREYLGNLVLESAPKECFKELWSSVPLSFRKTQNILNPCFAFYSEIDKPEKIILLKELGFNPNCSFGTSESTLLINCMGAELFEVAYFLIDTGADLSARDPFGLTPYMVAEITGNNVVKEYLLQMGARAESAPQAAIEDFYFGRDPFVRDLILTVKRSSEKTGFRIGKSQLNMICSSGLSSVYRLWVESFKSVYLLRIHIFENQTARLVLLDSEGFKTHLEFDHQAGYNFEDRFTELLIQFLKKSQAGRQEGSRHVNSHEIDELKWAFETFNVPSDTSYDGVITAFRILAKQFHPDLLGPNASKVEREAANIRMQKLNQAYDCISEYYRSKK